jgi:hypothetical protein
MGAFVPALIETPASREALLRAFSALALAVVVATVACGSHSPTSPSSLTPTTSSLGGQISDRTTGAGIPGAAVSIVDGPNAGKSTTTDSLGYYSLTGLQQAGFTITVSANNYVAQSKGVTLTSNQTLSFQLEPSGPAFSGVKYDNIRVGHEFIVGSPVPTQDQTGTYCCWPLPVRNAGSFVFDLGLFPLNVLPSGGSSNILSESEMVLVGLNVSPATGTVTFQWHRAVTQDVVIFTYTGSPSYFVTYSYIGHFAWEIAEAGSYYVVVETPWGGARLDFLVTNSALRVLRTPDDTIFLASRKPLNSGTRQVTQRTGGGGGISDLPRATRAPR